MDDTHDLRSVRTGMRYNGLIRLAVVAAAVVITFVLTIAGQHLLMPEFRSVRPTNMHGIVNGPIDQATVSAKLGNELQPLLAKFGHEVGRPMEREEIDAVLNRAAEILSDTAGNDAPVADTSLATSRQLSADSATNDAMNSIADDLAKGVARLSANILPDPENRSLSDAPKGSIKDVGKPNLSRSTPKQRLPDSATPRGNGPGENSNSHPSDLANFINEAMAARDQGAPEDPTNTHSNSATNDESKNSASTNRTPGGATKQADSRPHEKTLDEVLEEVRQQLKESSEENTKKNAPETNEQSTTEKPAKKDGENPSDRQDKVNFDINGEKPAPMKKLQQAEPQNVDRPTDTFRPQPRTYFDSPRQDNADGDFWRERRQQYDPQVQRPAGLKPSYTNGQRFYIHNPYDGTVAAPQNRQRPQMSPSDYKMDWKVTIPQAPSLPSFKTPSTGSDEPRSQLNPSGIPSAPEVGPGVGSNRLTMIDEPRPNNWQGPTTRFDENAKGGQPVQTNGTNPGTPSNSSVLPEKGVRMPLGLDMKDVGRSGQDDRLKNRLLKRN